MGSTSYQVTVGSRTLTVTLRREGEAIYARVDDGEEVAVSLAAVQGTLRALAVGERRVELQAERRRDTVLLALEGLQYEAEVVDARRASLERVAGAAPGGHARRELKAPMPGLVAKLLCQAGDTVAKGQPLVVLQAMKMENELSLPYEGTVKSTNVQPGQTVDQGQVLVILE